MVYLTVLRHEFLEMNIVTGIFVATLVQKRLCQNLRLAELGMVHTPLGMRGTDDLLCVNFS